MRSLDRYVPGNQINAAYNIAENHAIAMEIHNNVPFEVGDVYVTPCSLSVSTHPTEVGDIYVTPCSLSVSIHPTTPQTKLSDMELFEIFTNPALGIPWPEDDK